MKMHLTTKIGCISIDQECVKSKAMASMLAVQNDLTREYAQAVIKTVFSKCYADLEPIGRRFCCDSTESAAQAYADFEQFSKK